MDRNREARRVNTMAAPSNGLSSSRRRHRSSSLRDSPDEDGGMEVQEQGRLRDRGGVVKKDRDRERERERDRERERERERSRIKRRRENRMMSHREDGEDTSEESVNDEEEDEDDAGNGGGGGGGGGSGGGLRMLPPPPANPPSASNHHSHSNNIINNNNSYSQQALHRKSFPSSNSNKVFRGSGSPAAPPPAWKAADEMIGVSVPRKARSASTKRSHEWSSSSGVIGGTGIGTGIVTGTGTGTELIHRQSSTSPAPEAPLSPSSSSVSARKKMKANGSTKPRPPKSSSKSSSSNPEELEIEIAEVLYGLMTQSQGPSKKDNPLNDSTAKFESNKSSSETKSTSLSAVAPKRKRPRQVSENPFSVRNSPVSSSMKTEADHHQQNQQQQHQSPKTDISSPYLENSSPASAVAAENGTSFGFTTLPSSETAAPPLPAEAGEEAKCGVGVGVVLTTEEAEKESPAAGLKDGNNNNNFNNETVITTDALTKTTDLKAAIQETENKKEEKFEIDLMAPPPQQRTSQENDGDIEFSNHKQNLPEASKSKEDLKLMSGKEETIVTKTGSVQETGESSKQAMNEERKLDLRLDFEKPNKDSGGSNRSLHQALKHQQLSTKSETHTEKTAQPSSLPIPMPVANWPPMGYVAPLQGVISMDGNAMPSAPVQPLFTHPRPKRCATHCYIARNIHYLQQLMKINPFWPSASASAAPMFGSKPSTELQSHIPQSMQDKSQQVGIFPGQSTVKESKSSQTTNVPDPALRKQQVLLQQAMPPVAPNNILHGPAFIFPFNQQQAAVAAASVRPGTSKLSTSTATGASAAANTATVSSSATPAAVPALSFNYPNMSANDTQYLAIVQNHPYAFPMPAAVGAPPNYRANHPHPQAMPLFNGSFYSSQMIHPSQIPQPPQPAPPPTQAQQTHQNSSGSTSSSQKHLQSQQRQQGSGAGAGGGPANGSGLHNNYPAAHKSRSQQMNPPAQARHLENEVTGGEDSPSTADSRVSRAATSTIGVYSHNFAMPVHTQNFALMTPQSASATSSADKKPQQVLKRVGAESSPLQPPQTFAMSFAPMNGAQNHAMFQNLPESVRQGYHHMISSSAASASAHHSEPKKDFRITEESSRNTTGHDSSNPDDDRKLPAKSGQSIAFSRPDLVTDASGSSAAAISANSLNLGSNARSTRSPISTSAAQSSHHLHAQFQQQLQKHQQHNQNQNMNARSKTLNPNQPPSSNGAGAPYPDHLITSSSSMAAKFPNSLSSFPLQTSTTNSSSVQSPQWRNSVRGPTAPSTTSSLKNLHQTQQQQSSRSQVSHTQISFGASQKLQPTPTQMQQQQQSQNPSSNNSASPPMLVGSPTTSSLSSQPPKNTQISSPSILGNPHNSNVNKSQQQQQQHQLHKQQLQHQQQQQQRAYAQMMFTHPNMQVQQPPGQQHSVGSTPASGYYLPRKQQQQQSASSTAMLSLSPPVTLANTTTSDPAKAIAAATSNLKGGVGLVSQQGVLHAAQYGGGAVAAAAQSSMPAGFPYVHNAPPPAAVQVKPAEQKQPAGNDNLRTWQPEK